MFPIDIGHIVQTVKNSGPPLKLNDTLAPEPHDVDITMTTDHTPATTTEGELNDKATPVLQDETNAPKQNIQTGPMHEPEEDFLFENRCERIAAAAEAHVYHTTYITIWGFCNGISAEQVLSETDYIASNAGLTITDSLKTAWTKANPGNCSATTDASEYASNALTQSNSRPSTTTICLLTCSPRICKEEGKK